jgi:hypothetical protein
MIVPTDQTLIHPDIARDSYKSKMLDAVNAKDETPLLLAARHRQLSTMEILIMAG